MVVELALLIAFVLVFTHFMILGAKTFRTHESDLLGATLAQFSFLGTGALGTFYLAQQAHIPLANMAAAFALLAGSLTLYEWARRTIRDRGFHIAWSGDVPQEVCTEGPYRHIRHPVYASYLLAFLAQLVALPKPLTLAIFAFNVALYGHASISDERDLAKSPLGEAYARYKRKAGRFFPKLRRGGAPSI